MGAGASAAKDKNVVLNSTMASREFQGKHLGPEYEVSLLRPKMKDVNLNEKYILRVGYEALVLLTNNEEKTPITYFKYQDIISWGSTSKIFTFKVFGNAMNHHQPVSIVFSTPKGKEMEKITLESVHLLMADMDVEAVTKTDFNTLKAILAGKPVDEVMESDRKASVAKAHAASGASATSATSASSSSSTSTESTASTSAGDGAAAAAAAIARAEKREAAMHTAVEMDDTDDSTPKEPLKPLEGEEFLNTVAQFASTRSYTVFQAVQLMEIAMTNQSLDSFDRINFAVSLWKTSLNRDSFQLVVNVFKDPEDKENVIARIQASNTDKLSAGILHRACSDVGGGLDKPALTAATSLT